MGSCATLVTEAILAAARAEENDGDENEKVAAAAAAPSAASILAPGSPVGAMLAAAVLLDTQNMNPDAARATPRDAAALRTLAATTAILSDAGETEAFYQTLKRERFDQKGLSPRDLLRRDYKQWDMGGWRVGVSSFQIQLSSMGPEEEVTGACQAFSAARGLDLLVLMPSFDDEARGGAFTRQLAFFVPVVAAERGSGSSGMESVVTGMVAFLETGVGGLTPATEEKIHGGGSLASRAFYVGDPKASRKKVQPLLLEYLTREGVAKDES